MMSELIAARDGDDRPPCQIGCTETAQDRLRCGPQPARRLGRSARRLRRRRVSGHFGRRRQTQALPRFLERLAEGRMTARCGDDVEQVTMITACSVGPFPRRSEEHTSELQSLMRTSYASFSLKQK